MIHVEVIKKDVLMRRGEIKFLEVKTRTKVSNEGIHSERKQLKTNLLLQRISQGNTLECAADKIFESEDNWDLLPDM